MGQFWGQHLNIEKHKVFVNKPSSLLFDSRRQVGAPSLPQDRRTKKNQGKSFYSIYRSKNKTLQFVLDHLESSDNIPDAKNRISYY